MKPALQDKLQAQYPEILKCYIDVNDGWYDLLDGLCLQLERERLEAESKMKGPKATLEINQIKEKFGMLRVYVNMSSSISNNVFDLIEQAEIASSSICEDCGAPGKIVNNKSYLRIAC